MQKRALSRQAKYCSVADTTPITLHSAILAVSHAGFEDLDKDVFIDLDLCVSSFAQGPC